MKRREGSSRRPSKAKQHIKAVDVSAAKIAALARRALGMASPELFCSEWAPLLIESVENTQQLLDVSEEARLRMKRDAEGVARVATVYANTASRLIEALALWDRAPAELKLRAGEALAAVVMGVLRELRDAREGGPR